VDRNVAFITFTPKEICENFIQRGWIQILEEIDAEKDDYLCGYQTPIEMDSVVNILFKAHPEYSEKIGSLHFEAFAMLGFVLCAVMFLFAQQFFLLILLLLFACVMFPIMVYNMHIWNRPLQQALSRNGR